MNYEVLEKKEYLKKGNRPCNIDGVTSGYSVDAVKAKWRNLRDTYTAECRKMYKRSRGKEPMVRSKWVWFASMDFLRPHLKRLRELQEGKPPGLTPIAGRGAGITAYHRLKKVMKEEEEDEELKDEDQLIENVEVDMLPSETLLQAVQHLEEDENGAVITEINDDSVGPPGGGNEVVNSSHNSHGMVNYGLANAAANGSMGGRKRPWTATSTPYSNNHVTTMDRKRSRQLRSLEEEFSMREVDDTFHFLISLREPLKSLALDRQMFVRYKIQELLFNETYDHQKSLQNEHVEHVESTPEIMALGNIKMEPPN
ncbi:uncharacterized protein isoform X2 [Rhodnius prolixus]|uniref:uncharacterized protein isoform X2 n=1 Tax=Rhodnius prolixus TaxID=13249 RepID=UPI003D18EB7E